MAFVLSAAVLTGAPALPVLAADRPSDSGIDRSMDFEIPAQPLSRAMLAFSRITDVQVLYDSRDAEGVSCNPVHGRMSGGQALRELLNGTGLVIHYVGPRAVTLVLPRGAEAPADLNLDTLRGEAAPLRIGGDPRFTAYAEEVLADVRRALQSDAALGQGRRRAVTVKLWLTPDGHVQRAEIVKSTGDPAIDAALSQRLAGVAVRRGPPDGLPQPLIYEFWTGPGS